LSIDTEGGELDILKSIDFRTLPVEMISVENNYFSDDIESHMTTCGYTLVAIAGKDEFYRKTLGRKAHGHDRTQTHQSVF
jgi:hypothetical protein